MWTSPLLGSSSTFRQPLKRLGQFQSRGEEKKGDLRGCWGRPKARHFLFHPSRGGGREKVVLGKLFVKKGPWVGVSAGKGGKG